MSLASQIADLESILDAGATSVFVDGQKVTYDLDGIRQRLAELRRQQDQMRRPRTATLDLSNF